MSLTRTPLPGLLLVLLRQRRARLLMLPHPRPRLPLRRQHQLPSLLPLLLLRPPKMMGSRCRTSLAKELRCYARTRDSRV